MPESNSLGEVAYQAHVKWICDNAMADNRQERWREQWESIAAAVIAEHTRRSEDPITSPPPKRSGTLKVTLHDGGRGKPLECEEDGDPAWALVEACELALKNALPLIRKDYEEERESRIELRAALALIAAERVKLGAA